MCGLSTLCYGKQIWCVLTSPSFDGLQRDAATGGVLVQLCRLYCIAQRIAAGWVWYGTTPRLARKIMHTKRSIKKLPSSIFTARFWRMWNHTLTHNSPKRTWRRIAPYRRSGFCFLEQKWGIILRLLWLTRCGGRCIWHMWLMPAPVAMTHLAVCMEATLTP